MYIFQLIATQSQRAGISVFEFARANKTAKHTIARENVCKTLYFKQRMNQERIASIVQRSQQAVCKLSSKK
jgi:DNA-directed RNA polymerase specialized sigma subunit